MKNKESRTEIRKDQKYVLKVPELDSDRADALKKLCPRTCRSKGLSRFRCAHSGYCSRSILQSSRDVDSATQVRLLKTLCDRYFDSQVG